MTKLVSKEGDAEFDLDSAPTEALWQINALIGAVDPAPASEPAPEQG